MLENLGFDSRYAGGIAGMTTSLWADSDDRLSARGCRQSAGTLLPAFEAAHTQEIWRFLGSRLEGEAQARDAPPRRQRDGPAARGAAARPAPAERPPGRAEDQRWRSAPAESRRTPTKDIRVMRLDADEPCELFDYSAVAQSAVKWHWRSALKEGIELRLPAAPDRSEAHRGVASTPLGSAL